MNKIQLFILGLLMIVVTSGWCQASHPYHVSNAEVNWNAKTGNFEVALCLWPSDLEKALAIQQSKPVDLEKVANLDELLKSYIEKRFLIRRPATAENSGNEPQVDLSPTIRWVGHEKNLKNAWLYFEIEVNKSQTDWSIENRVFFELNEDQLNQIQLTVGKSTKSMISSPGTARHLVNTEARGGFKNLSRRR